MPTDNPLGKPGIVKHTGLFLPSKEYVTHYPSGRLGVAMVNSLVTLVLCGSCPLDPSPGIYHESILLNQSIDPIFTEGVTCALQRVAA